MTDNAYDLLVDRVTPEDHAVFARLKQWSAASQVAADYSDSTIFSLLTRYPKSTRNLRARVSIEADGGENFE